MVNFSKFTFNKKIRKKFERFISKLQQTELLFYFIFIINLFGTKPDLDNPRPKRDCNSTSNQTDWKGISFTLKP